MTFALPIAALFALLAPIVVYLYMRRPQRRDLAVPSILFWSASTQSPSRHRRALGRIRSWLSLILILVALTLLILAVMQPQLRGLLAPSHTVILLDSRLRMQATSETSESAFHRAKAAALALASQAGPNHKVAIIRVGAGVRALTPFTGDTAKLLGILELQSPDDGSGDFTDAIDLARDLLNDLPGSHEAQIVAITDRQLETPSPDVEQILVGSPAANVAITEFGTRATSGLANAREVTLRAQNNGPTPERVEIDIRLDDQLIDTIPLDVAAGQSAGRTFSVATPADPGSRGDLTATIREPDTLAADNIRRAIMRESEPKRVLLVTESNWFLERAIAANESLSFELLTPAFWKNSMVSAFDVIVFDQFVPDGLFPAAFDETKFLFFGKSPWDNGETSKGDFAITDFRIDSPLLRGADLTDTRISQITELSPSAPSDVVVSSGDTPLISAVRDANNTAQAFAFHFPIDATDLPLRAAFPILLANAIAELAPQPDNASERVGQTIVTDADSVTTVHAFDQAGFYQIEGNRLAVNPDARAESDHRINSTTPVANRLTGGMPGMWQLLALLAAFALLAEAALKRPNRRLTAQKSPPSRW